MCLGSGNRKKIEKISKKKTNDKNTECSFGEGKTEEI